LNWMRAILVDNERANGGEGLAIRWQFLASLSVAVRCTRRLSLTPRLTA
jgi:hypothetical protein